MANFCFAGIRNFIYSSFLHWEKNNTFAAVAKVLSERDFRGVCSEAA